MSWRSCAFRLLKFKPCACFLDRQAGDEYHLVPRVGARLNFHGVSRDAERFGQEGG